MPLPIERRVAALEQRTRCDQLIEVIIITFVSPGPNGPIDVPPIGYATLSDEPELRWFLRNGP